MTTMTTTTAASPATVTSTSANLLARIRGYGAHELWRHSSLLRTTEERAFFRHTLVVAAKIFVLANATALERLLRELDVWHEEFYAVAIDAIKRGDSYETVVELIQTISDHRHKHRDLWSDVCTSIIEPCMQSHKSF